ncbi:hypothetical protein H4219_002493 [Mycoemilia scoparia]|uniref:Uncharacterized protein n=1 Tax=Mycoemilia scoparia TaxID=417184 RepID=A0A9W8A5E4_9FUNG|nr:hypothetical protein H4219_002493 [Mycoemilia scoparia]
MERRRRRRRRGEEYKGDLSLNLQIFICQYIKDQEDWPTLCALKAVTPNWDACVNSVVWQNYTPPPQGIWCKENDPIYYTLRQQHSLLLSGGTATSATATADTAITNEQEPDLNYHFVHEGYKYMRTLTINSDCVAYPWLFNTHFGQLYHLQIYPDDHLLEKVESLINYNNSSIGKLSILSTAEFNDPSDEYYYEEEGLENIEGDVGDDEEEDNTGSGRSGPLGLVDIWDEHIPLCRIFKQLSSNLVHLALKTIVRVPSFYFILTVLPRLEYLEIDHLIIDDFSTIEVAEPTTPSSCLTTFALNFLLISQPNVLIETMPPINTALIPNLTELIHDAPVDESEYKVQGWWCSVLPFISFPFSGQWTKLRKMTQVTLSHQVTKTLCNHCPNLEHLELDLRPTCAQEFHENVAAFHMLLTNQSRLKVLGLGQKYDFDVTLPLDQLFFKSKNDSTAAADSTTADGDVISSPLPTINTTFVNPLYFGPSDAFKFACTNLTHLRISLAKRLTPLVFNSLCQFQQLEVLSIRLTTFDSIETLNHPSLAGGIAVSPPPPTQQQKQQQVQSPMSALQTKFQDINTNDNNSSPYTTIVVVDDDNNNSNNDNNNNNNNSSSGDGDSRNKQRLWFPKLQILKFNLDDDSVECAAEDLRNLIRLFPNLAIFEVLPTKPIFFFELEMQFPHIKFKW